MRFFLTLHSLGYTFVRTKVKHYLLIRPDFFPLNPGPQISAVKEHGRAVCHLDVGESPLMGKFPQEPLRDTQKPRRISAANEALGIEVTADSNPPRFIHS